MFTLWASVAFAQGGPVFTIGYEPQLVDGTIRLISGGVVVGEVWTDKNGGDAVEIWASTRGPEEPTAGVTFEYLTGPIPFDQWMDNLLDDEDPTDPYDNWIEMCIA